MAAKDRHSAVDGRVRRHAAYRQSLKVRKRIEEAFGWIKTVGGLAKTKLIGRPKLAGQALLCFAAYNLVRIGSLCALRDPHHACIQGYVRPKRPKEPDNGRKAL